jgi:replicative DNA helicase
MAILATEKVLTLDYWKMAGDIRKGDFLFDRFGKPVKVKLIQQYRATNCYEAQFNDGLTIAGDAYLKLPLESENYRKQVRKYKGTRKFRRQPKPTTLSDLIETPLTGRENRKEFSVPTAGALEFPHIDLPVPPFVFGYWFFNRRKSGGLAPPPEFRDVIREKLKDHGYLPSHQKVFTTKPTIVSHLVPNIPYKIPNNYLLSSPEQRLELLKGILHSKTKQYNKQTGIFRFTNRKKELVCQVQYLAESLGARTILDYDQYKNYYTVFIRTRLQLTHEQIPRPIKVRQEWRLVKDVYEIDPQACVHIETEGFDNSYLVGEGFIPCL